MPWEFKDQLRRIAPCTSHRLSSGMVLWHQSTHPVTESEENRRNLHIAQCDGADSWVPRHARVPPATEMAVENGVAEADNPLSHGSRCLAREAALCRALGARGGFRRRGGARMPRNASGQRRASRRNASCELSKGPKLGTSPRLVDHHSGKRPAPNLCVHITSR